VGLRMAHLLGQLLKGQLDVFIAMCVITSSASLTCTHLFGKQVSGGWVVCRVLSLASRSASQVTMHFDIS
jgi:hypothetical protein